MKQKMNAQLTDPISPAYQRFFDKMPEHATLDTSKWQVVHILGYFCARYKKHYGVDYTFRFNNPAPSKSYEVFRIKSLAQMLSSDPLILKDYIDWLFETEVIARKKRITALGFITNVELVNKYKFLKLVPGNKTIDRSTKLPPNYLAIVQKYNPMITNYGELVFYLQTVDVFVHWIDNPHIQKWSIELYNSICEPKIDFFQENKGILEELHNAGMDMGMLGKIK